MYFHLVWRSIENITHFLYVCTTVFTIFILFCARRARASFLSSPFVLSFTSSLFPVLKLLSLSLSVLAMRNCSGLARKLWRHTHIASAGVGARESASWTYLRDGTCASAIFHYDRKVRGGCVHSAKSGRHPPQKLLSRRHNSGTVCLPARDVLFALRIAVSPL